MIRETPCCLEFGFDDDKIRRRLAFLYLSGADQDFAQRLQQDVIIPNVDSIIDQFYDILTFQPESRRILTTGELIQSLKKTQRDYLLSLGVDFESTAYFEERLRIGLAHARVGIPLSVYQCAYRGLTQIIIDTIPASISDDPKIYKSIVSFLLKITTLDMSELVQHGGPHGFAVLRVH